MMLNYTVCGGEEGFYKSFLGVALELCSEFQLVERGRGAHSVSTFIHEMEMWRVSAESSSSWPGTEIQNDTAILHRFVLSQGAIDILGARASCFSDWQEPELPEDLAFYRRDGTWLLGSIAHEDDVFLVINDYEEELLRRINPEIFRYLREDN